MLRRKITYKPLAFLIAVLFLPTVLPAQSTRVRGRVTAAADGTPMQFVSVVFPGTTTGITTDEAEEAEVEQPIAGKPLKRSFVDFLSNLSPYDKLIGGTLIFIVLLSLMALAHSMKGGSGGNMTFVWIAAIVIFGIAEAATAGLVSIWFVAGAVAALLALELGAVLWLQIVVFLAVSIAALIATRPLAHKMLDKTIVPTNADRVLGQTARVTENIDNAVPTGAVYVGGMTWTARSESGQPIPRPVPVQIVRMEGVRLFVEPV